MIADLGALWDALERRRAVVDRIDVTGLEADTYAALVHEAERRLRVLAEAELPGPAEYRNSDPEAPTVTSGELERLVVLIASALHDAPKVYFLRGAA